jgi:hypothetical protein
MEMIITATPMATLRLAIRTTGPEKVSLLPLMIRLVMKISKFKPALFYANLCKVKKWAARPGKYSHNAVLPGAVKDSNQACFSP